MVKISVEIENSLTGLLEDYFCEFGVSNWGIERINDKTPPELFGYFENDAEADESYKSLRDSFPELPEFYSMEQVNDVDWQNEYKKFLKPWNFENLHWVPLWMRGEYEVGRGDLVLYFDAGLAFGTGDHPTTRLCAMSMLEYAKAQDVSGKYIIDAGCGSGILALSAKLLGFGKILGFDRDEEAVRVARGQGDEDRLLHTSFFSYDRGSRATELLLACKKPFTAVMYPDDFTAISAYRDLAAAGYRVGENISVTGFDGVNFGEMVMPKLTTIRQDAVRIGENAAQMLLELIDGKPVPGGKTRLDAGLVLGESVHKLA